jgi:hypothetical protein
MREGSLTPPRLRNVPSGGAGYALQLVDFRDALRCAAGQKTVGSHFPASLGGDLLHGLPVRAAVALDPAVDSVGVHPDAARKLNLRNALSLEPSSESR